MFRWSPLFFFGLVLLLAGCTTLDENAEPENLIPLSALPADYGELVTVLHSPGDKKAPPWDEMWFENEDTGTLTRVFLHRPTWSYDPNYVQQIKRAGAQTETGR